MSPTGAYYPEAVECGPRWGSTVPLRRIEVGPACHRPLRSRSGNRNQVPPRALPLIAPEPTGNESRLSIRRHRPTAGHALPTAGRPLPSGSPGLPSVGRYRPSSGEALPSRGPRRPSGGPGRRTGGEDRPFRGRCLRSGGPSRPTGGRQRKNGGQRRRNRGQCLPSVPFRKRTNFFPARIRSVTRLRSWSEASSETYPRPGRISSPTKAG